jgi:hypothetical protein
LDNFFAICRKNDNKNGQIIWSQDQIDFIVREYNLCHSTTKIAKKFNVSSGTIRNLLRKQKIEVLTLSELQKVKFPRNSSFFEKIDTPQKAYWLGFLYADGYISKENAIRISLKKEDEEHLKNFLSAISYTNGTIKYSQKRNNNKIFYQSYISLRDNKMKQDLERNGCFNNKSLVLKFPYKEVPESLYSHFIRGYFDGDGCLTYSQSGKNKRPNYKLSFIGTEDFLNGIKKVLKKENLSLQQKGNYFVLDISGNKQLVNILKYLYKDSFENIYLSRKKEKYDNFLLKSIGGELVNTRCE